MFRDGDSIGQQDGGLQNVLIRKEVALAKLDREVRGFTPEMLQAPEKREHILETMQSGMELIGMDVLMEAEEQGLTVQDVALTKLWPIADVARSLLTRPLPPQAFEYEDDEEVPLEAQVADEQDWWQVLSTGQKRALSEIIHLDLTITDSFSSPEDTRDVVHIVAKAEQPIVFEDDSQIYPLLIWNPHHGFGITPLPVVDETS